MEFHPAADIFPMLEGEEFETFVQDIKEHGLKEPIVTYKGKIIDGRNRFKACRELNIKPIYVEWDGEGSLIEYVVSLNLHRRHLTTNQRAMLGVTIQEQMREEAQQRQLAGVKPPAEICGRSEDTRDAAAKAVKTSHFNVDKARVVVEKGVPSLIAAVEADQVAVHNAADLATLDPDEQREIVAQGPDEMLRKAQEIRKEKQTKKPSATAANEPIAARGLSAVAKRMDEEVERWAKSKQPYAEHVFNAMRELRKDLIGR